jgi:hypothetical protein
MDSTSSRRADLSEVQVGAVGRTSKERRKQMSGLEVITEFYAKHEVCRRTVSSSELNPQTGAIEITPAVQVGDDWKIDLRCKGCGTASSFTMTSEDVRRVAQNRAAAIAAEVDPMTAIRLLVSPEWEANLRSMLKSSPGVKEQIRDEYKKAESDEPKH